MNLAAMSRFFGSMQPQIAATSTALFDDVPQCHGPQRIQNIR